MDQTIDYINKKFDGNVKIDTKKNDLTVEFYKNDKIYRKDDISFDDIDMESIEYNKDEEAIIISCIGRDKCVYRRLYKEKIKRYYSRINIPYIGEEKSTLGLQKAFKHLVRLAKDDSYKGNEPFE